MAMPHGLTPFPSIKFPTFKKVQILPATPRRRSYFATSHFPAN
jgi:hypothetical protein